MRSDANALVLDDEGVAQSDGVGPLLAAEGPGAVADLDGVTRVLARAGRVELRLCTDPRVRRPSVDPIRKHESISPGTRNRMHSSRRKKDAQKGVLRRGRADADRGRIRDRRVRDIDSGARRGRSGAGAREGLPGEDGGLELLVGGDLGAVRGVALEELVDAEAVARNDVARVVVRELPLEREGVDDDVRGVVVVVAVVRHGRKGFGYRGTRGDDSTWGGDRLVGGGEGRQC